MVTALVEKLHRTYMLAARWRKETWLKVERIMGAQSVPDAHIHTHTDLVQAPQEVKTHMWAETDWRRG